MPSIADRPMRARAGRQPNLDFGLNNTTFLFYSML
jgi:hypothetical protein